jgi:hypothetical protein
MRLKVELEWRDGIRVDGDRDPPGEPFYFLIDADTGRHLTELTFESCNELEAYIMAHHPGSERWTPPPAEPQDAARLERVLALLDRPRSQEFDPDYARGYARPTLIAELYQSGYPPETVERIRRALGLPGPRP